MLLSQCPWDNIKDKMVWFGFHKTVKLYAVCFWQPKYLKSSSAWSTNHMEASRVGLIGSDEKSPITVVCGTKATLCQQKLILVL